MPLKLKPPVGKAKISNIPTLPKINEVDGVSQLSTNLTVLVVVPPDGGFAWVIVAATFVCNFLIDGIVYSFGILMVHMAGTLNVSLAKVALIGSVQVGVFYLSGPFVCVAVQHFGFRKTAVFGAMVSATGMFAASWCKEYLAVLVLYGMISIEDYVILYSNNRNPVLPGGLGNGILSSPSVIIVGYYFEKYRAIASGLAMCGSSAGIIVMSPLFEEFDKRWGWQRTMQLQAALIVGCGILSLTFKAIEPAKLTVEEDDREPYQLDACADAISETSSQIEFSYIYPEVKVIDLKHSTMAKDSSVQQDKFSVVSRRTGAVSMKTFRSRYASVYHYEVEAVAPDPPTKSRRCLSCCRSKPPTNESTVIGTTSMLRTGPLNRQDIFYGGSLVRMSTYNNDQKFRADLQNEAVPGAANKGKWHMSMKPLRNLLQMLIDVSLLKSPTYGVISLGLFLYVYGLFTPYMYLAKRSLAAGIPVDITRWLVSILSIGNLAGRFMAGFVSFFPRIDPSTLVGCTTIVGACITMVTAFWLVDVASVQIGYGVTWGFFIAFNSPLRTIIFVKYLGLDRLTNAFGLSMLVMGVAALAGSPTAGLIIEQHGNHSYAFAVSGGCHLLSGVLFLILSCVHKREVKKKKASRKT